MPFSLKDTLANRKLPPGYNASMGIVLLLGRRPVSITHLRNAPCPQSVVVHFKSLFPIDAEMASFIRVQLLAMQRLFAENEVAVLPGTTEDLSGNTSLQPLQDLDAPCRSIHQVTQEQRELFANRQGVGSDELVIYIVSTIIGGETNHRGCAAHPIGQPGATIALAGTFFKADDWVSAHEVGHVLGLEHVCEFPSTEDPLPSVPCKVEHRDSLMFPRSDFAHLPPNLSDGESVTMRNSSLTKPC